MRLNLKVFATVSIPHFLISMVCLLYSFGAGMERFDNPPPASWAETSAAAVADVLFLPGSLLWTSRDSQNLSSLFEWLLLLANSALREQWRLWL